MEISKKKLRKIAYIITLSDLGGAQSHLYEVIMNIGNYGYSPLLITGKNGWLTDELKAKGIACHIVPELVRRISPLKDITAVIKIKKILQQEEPALVHCHSSKAGIIGRIAAHGCNIPTIFTAHGWAFTDGVSPLKRKIYALIENLTGYWTDRIICVSEYDRKLGIKYLPVHTDKMITIHNCIPDMPDNIRDWQNNPVGDVINVIVVARFSPPKKNIRILYLLRKMLDQGIRITVTFVGDGPQLNMAKNVANKLHLENEAFFLGARTDVPKLLPNYDLFLLLSNWEGFPISILEAMRAGIPVVASNVGGCGESICNGYNGWLIDYDEQIIKYLSINSLKIAELGKNARLLYKKEFVVEKMICAIINEYNNILNIQE